MYDVCIPIWSVRYDWIALNNFRYVRVPDTSLHNRRDAVHIKWNTFSRQMWNAPIILYVALRQSSCLHGVPVWTCSTVCRVRKVIEYCAKYATKSEPHSQPLKEICEESKGRQLITEGCAETPNQQCWRERFLSTGDMPSTASAADVQGFSWLHHPQPGWISCCWWSLEWRSTGHITMSSRPLCLSAYHCPVSDHHTPEFCSAVHHAKAA